MWDLATTIAMNRRRQAEYDATHPKEAARRRAEDRPPSTDRPPDKAADAPTGPPQNGQVVPGSQEAAALRTTLMLYAN